MLMHGAGQVNAVDYSATNVETTRRNAALFDFSNVSVQQGTLAELPFPDETFDVVWCNGVLQHAADPDRCLREITRVLKLGGSAWIYVYGAGGVYWYAIRRFRELFRDIPTSACIAALRLIRCETRYVAEYIDDWKVDFLRTYTAEDMSRRLAELGFRDATPLKYGTSYDTSHRINLHPADRVWLGDGDLRYWTVKSESCAPGTTPLSAGEYGSVAAFAPEIISRFEPVFDAMAKEVENDPLLAMAVAANVQRELRDLLSTREPFDPEAFASRVERALDWARAWRSGCTARTR